MTIGQDQAEDLEKDQKITGALSQDRGEADFFGLRGKRGGLLPVRVILFFRAIGPHHFTFFSPTLTFHFSFSCVFNLCLHLLHPCRLWLPQYVKVLLLPTLVFLHAYFLLRWNGFGFIHSPEQENLTLLTNKWLVRQPLSSSVVAGRATGITTEATRLACHTCRDSTIKMPTGLIGFR